MAAAVQRRAIEGELQRFKLRVTRRTVPIMFLMISAGGPSLLTVRISSNPSRILFETPGAFAQTMGEIADQPLRLCRVVEFPGLTQRTPDRGMQSRRRSMMFRALCRRRHKVHYADFKSMLGFRQFLLRGLENVRNEWSLVTMAWNIKRIIALSPRTESAI
jgi:hypothetical protein